MTGPALKTGTRCVLCLPGETGREFWRQELNDSWKKLEPGYEPAEEIFAIEAAALDSIPFWAIAPEDGKVDVAAVASLKWHALLGAEDIEGKSWTHWEVARPENRVLVAGAGLAETTESPWQGRMPQAFDLAPRLFVPPGSEAAVWKELGRYVVAFSRGGRLLHFSMLSSRRLDAAAAREIRALCLALEAQSYITQMPALRIWTGAEADFLEALKLGLGTPVRLEEKPAPVLPEEACEIYPPEMARAAKNRAEKRRWKQMITALAAVYVLFFAIWSGWLVWQRQKLAMQSAQLARLRPEIEAVRMLQARWQALELATNPDGYPTEIFHRVASLLPDEGIQLKEFLMENDRLVVSGKASTNLHAKKFQADLTGDAGLNHYAWNFPQPTILEDNQASFRAEGTLNSGKGIHEGQ